MHDIRSFKFKPNMSHIYQFGEFQLDVKEETLHRNGEKININRRTFQVLQLLIEHPGEIVSKQDFFDTIWKDTFVEDNSLTVTMTTLRKILGDNAKEAVFIQNIPRKGYRFISEVRIIEPDQPNDKAEETEKISNEPQSKPKIGKVAALVLMLGLGISLSLIGANYYSKRHINPFTSDKTTIDSIAVLPFENQNLEIEYIADGLTDSLINNLSKVSDLKVINRNSAFQYKNKDRNFDKIGKELNVNAILTGRFIQRGNELIINSELTDLRTGKQIWGKQYIYELSNVFAFQQEISHNITETLRSKLTRQEQERLAKKETDNPEAYRLYLKGRYHLNRRTEEDFEKGIEFFQKAVEKDPTYALAYVGLANCYALRTTKTISVPERMSLVHSAIQKALEIDENLSEAYAVLAVNNFFHDWNWHGAEKGYKKAIELNPNYADARHWYAEFLAMQERFEESFAEYDRALEIDPLSLAIRTDLGYAYFYARQYDKSINYLQNIKKIDPTYPRTYFFLNEAYRINGMFKESIDEYIAFYSMQGESQEKLRQTRAILENGLRTGGENGYWRDYLRLRTEIGYSMFEAAIIHAKLDEKEKTFEFLEKAYLEKTPALTYLKARPEFDDIRSDPRFQNLVDRIGFPK